jgi:hypothetical protein
MGGRCFDGSDAQLTHNTMGIRDTIGGPRSTGAKLCTTNNTGPSDASG